jgi:signal transduction histidine kinase
MMASEQPEVLEVLLQEAPPARGWTRTYPWLGLLSGVAAAVFVGHPLSMVVNNIHGYFYAGSPLEIGQAIAHSFAGHMWPMMLLYSLSGGAIGGLLGFIFQRLQENRQRLDTLHQEFELQVATLRHHYKNLALGIHGFSSRIRKKLVNLDEQFRRCARDNCPTYADFRQDYEALERHAAILEEAAGRLTHLLSQELLFLKALTSDTLTAEPQDFYAFLVHSVQDLLGMRFREKDLRVEINGQPLEECRDTLVFRFEPYTMEVILQNILANAMKYGDLIQIQVREKNDRVRVAVTDNGPGLEVAQLQSRLLVLGNRREAESSHLGLRVSLHLLEKCGGRLLARSAPGAGATFSIEVPKETRPGK